MSNKTASRRQFVGMSLGLALLTPRLRAPMDRSPLHFSALSDPERIKELLQQKKPVTWLFSGDSVTAGVEHTHGLRSYTQIFEERIHWELKRPNDLIVNTGISATTTMELVDDWDDRVGRFQPAMVSLMFGINDAARKDMDTSDFQKNLTGMLNKIRYAGAIPVLHTPNVIMEEKAPERSRLPQFAAAIRSLAAEQKVILVDHFEYWNEVRKSQPENTMYREWLNDPLHPNGQGHREIAYLLFKNLSLFDAMAASCGGKYYEGDH